MGGPVEWEGIVEWENQLKGRPVELRTVIEWGEL